MLKQRSGTCVTGWIRDFYIEPQDGQVPSRAPYVSEDMWLMGPPQILPQGEPFLAIWGSDW